MTTHLREELTALAETQSFSPDPAAWDRGRRVRRRDRVVRVAAVVAVVALVAGVGALAVQPDQEARTASTEEVPGGAIPSRIEDPDGLETESDLAVGRASVAFASSDGQPVVVTATDGRYHALALAGWDGALLSLSPEGSSLAWSFQKDTSNSLLTMKGLTVLDLTSGETSQRLTSGTDGAPSTPQQVSWSPSGQWLTWFDGDAVGRMPVDTPSLETSDTAKQVEWSAVDDEGVVTFYAQGPRQWLRDGSYGRMKMADDTTFDAARQGRNDAAIASPTGQAVALASGDAAAAVDFLAGRRFKERALAPDLYPDGAAVRPLGWAADSLLLAEVDGPAGSYVEGRHLALLTSPDRPKSEWTYRIVLRDLPDVAELSVAADLVPDLDGTSSQQLTHDFPLPSEGGSGWMPLVYGAAGVLAALLGLVLLGTLRRRA